MLTQLTLGVGLKDETTFENFYSGANSELITELKKISCIEGERLIYFYGTHGQGKTHLLQACCHLADQNAFRSVYIPLSHPFSPEILFDLEQCSLICMDDLDRVIQKPEWEEALFHLYNRTMMQAGRWVVTANVSPKILGVRLPDLASRLMGGTIYALQPLSDEEKLQVLITRAGHRGMTLSEEVGKFLLTHCPRHMNTFFAALDALDTASLAAQRRLTIPFVKAVLEV